MTQTKSCSCCMQVKPITAFHIRTDRKTLQYQSICKQCGLRKNRIRRRRGHERAWKSVAVAENNAFNLWHGPVSREQPLRWCA